MCAATRAATIYNKLGLKISVKGLNRANCSWLQPLFGLITVLDYPGKCCTQSCFISQSSQSPYRPCQDNILFSWKRSIGLHVMCLLLQGNPEPWASLFPFLQIAWHLPVSGRLLGKSMLLESLGTLKMALKESYHDRTAFESLLGLF